MRVLRGFSTSVGSKLLVALTGTFLVGFLIFHLAGNLLLFFGPESLNEHAHALISNPLIVPAELGLLAIFLLHVFKAVAIVAGNRNARPERYAKKVWARGPSRKSVGSSTMILSGIFLIAFVVLHLGTFKYGPHYQVSGATDVRDLYRLMIEVFHRPGYVVFYVISMLIIGLHLRHGVSSAWQSLGLMPASWTNALLRTGLAVAVVITAGFVLIPVWVYFFL